MSSTLIVFQYSFILMLVRSCSTNCKTKCWLYRKHTQAHSVHPDYRSYCYWKKSWCLWLADELCVGTLQEKAKSFLIEQQLNFHIKWMRWKSTPLISSHHPRESQPKVEGWLPFLWLQKEKSMAMNRISAALLRKAVFRIRCGSGSSIFGLIRIRLGNLNDQFVFKKYR